MSASVATPLQAQDAPAQPAADASEEMPADAPAEGSLAALKAAAEAIDPLGKAAEAVAAWKLYLDAVEDTGGPVTEQALALNKMGDSRYYQQDFAGALGSSLEAKRRLEEEGETQGEPMASTLANVATFYGATGQPDQELPLQERSLAIRQGLYGASPQGLAPEQAKALGLGYLNYSAALYSRGRFTEAATYIDPAIDGLVIGELKDATLFLSMTTGANILIDAGRSSDALAMAQRGTQLANELLPPRHPFAGIAQGSLARILLQTDRFEEAEGPARNALDILSEGIGPNHPYTLTSLHNLGVILASLGRFEESVELTTARFELTRESDPGESVISLVTASNALWESGDAAGALEQAQLAGTFAADIPLENEKAIRGIETLSLRLEEQGDFAGALALLGRPRMQDARDDVDAPRLLRRGLLNVRMGNLDTGWPMVEQAKALLTEAMLEQANRLELGADLSSYYESLMQIAEAAIAANKPAAALEAFELASWGVNARARQFLAFSADRSGEPELAAKIDTLRTDRERLRVLHREWTSLLASGNAELAAERKAAIDELTPQVEALGQSLEADVPDFARWLRPATPDLTQITERLASDEAILIAMPARHRTLIMALTTDGAAMAETIGGRPAIRPLVAQLRTALDSDPGAQSGDTAAFPFDAAKAVYDQILPPTIAARLAGKTRVSVITSDALSRIPFAILLPDVPSGTVKDVKDADWLAKSHAFSTALTPSEAFARSAVTGAGTGFLGVGAPDLAGDSGAAIAGAALYRGVSVSLEDVRALPALPATQAEVTNVAAAFGLEERTILTGAEATEARVRTVGPARRSVALFATHGLLAGEIGGLREPALVLTPPQQAAGADDDGLLQASEIARLGLAADLVILSACNSAAGRNTSAPAYTGLANAFLSSGTQSLMLSHWRVRDDAAARLTVDTLSRSRAGTDLATSLQMAQLELMQDTSVAGSAHPSIWAPFVLIGE